MRRIKQEVFPKPSDWPANDIEYKLENIFRQIKLFIENPTYKNREILISLVANYDLNQMSMLGLVRTTAYEVAMINELYLLASVHQIQAVKVFLYELIGLKTRMQKMISWFPNVSTPLEIEAFNGLCSGLNLYYFSYQKYTVENDKEYADQLVAAVEESIQYIESMPEKDKSNAIDYIARAYNTLINDISYFRSVKRTGLWAFDRKQIHRLYKLSARLVALAGDSPVKRPLKGVLMTGISNYILKSRNDYNSDYICKYVSADVARASISNGQIWLSKTEYLNDEREQKVVPELFMEDGWNQYTWAKDIDFTATRTYYVSSFCKELHSVHMSDDYGSCIYGYKDDRMADILAPVFYYPGKEGKRVPMLSQVVAFDVLYNREEAKEEINFLCSIIDEYAMTNEEKHSFLEQMLQYWILSVKDPKWAQERERRYVVFLYDKYEYLETDFSDAKFLKFKTTLFLEPDFILGPNPVKDYLGMMVDNKRNAISEHSYWFCNNCYSREFDTGDKMECCPICGSKDIHYERID